MTQNLAKRFDIAIAGSGASGLSLAWHLANNPDITQSIAFIDADLAPKTDKTWCFWDHSAVLKPEIIHRSWNKLSVIGPDWETTQELQTSRYYCVKSDVYQKSLLKDIKLADNITLFEEYITGIRPSKNGAQILTKNEMITASMLFQSIDRPTEQDLYKSERIALKQHFVGWEIRTSQPIFEPDTAILMDFRVTQEFGFAFVYVLPYSETEALVEFTLFSPRELPLSVYETELRNYLSQVWSVHDYKIDRRESGVIPMVDGVPSATNTHPLYAIGTAAGLTKASTGYTFSRIQQDSRRIAHCLSNGIPPNRSALSPWRFRFYDLLILLILRDEPEKGVAIFRQLFERNGFDAMFSFLDERTTFAEDLQIMSSVPSYSDFFKAIWKTKHRIGNLSR
jgi:lycopene beta-cyclase